MDSENLVELEEDPYWPDRYEQVREKILTASGEALLGVFHVGSTAVRDVPGKPTLDVIAVYEDEASRDAAGDALEETGVYERERSETVLVRWADEYAVFVKLHVRGDEKVRAQLAFREYLRENPDACEEYSQVKREAAADHPDDLEAYTKAKTEVVGSILDRAREEGYYERLPEFA